MKGMMRNSRKAMAAVALLFGWMLTGGQALAQNGNPNPGVFPPDSNPYGKSYSEWGAAFFRWVLSIPASQNPAIHTSGAFDNVGQSGPIFFQVMGDSSLGPVEKTFSVPAGKAIFFMITASWWDNACPPENPPLTVDQLRAKARSDIDSFQPTDQAASVDGVPLKDLSRYRFDTPIFSYSLTATDNYLQYQGCNVSGTISPAVGNGYWVILTPLPAGRHELRLPVFNSVAHITVGP